MALDIGPTGKLLAPLGDLPFEQALEAFAQVVEAGAQAGADCVLIETMNDLYEAKAAVLAAKEHCSLPVFVTMTFDEEGKLLTGGTLEAAAAVLEGLGVDALGLNCGLGPQQMLSLTRRLRQLTSLPILVDPNAGLPREEEGRTVFDVGPEEFAGWMEEIAKAGAQALGGCCGTTPAHIAALTARCGKLSPLPAPPCLQTVVASGMEAVSLRPGAGAHRGAHQPHREAQAQTGPAGEEYRLSAGRGHRPAGRGGSCAGRERGPAGDRRAGAHVPGNPGAPGRHPPCLCRSTPPTLSPWRKPCAFTTARPW